MTNPKYLVDQKTFNKEHERLKILKKEARGIFLDLENTKNLKNELKELIKKMNEKVEGADTKLEKLNSYNTRFEELRAKLDDESDGLEANFEWVKEKRKNTDKKYEEILKIQTGVENLKNDIQEYKKQIEELKNDSQVSKGEIEKWLDLVSDSSRYNEFNKRKKRLQIESYIWLGVTVLGFVGLSLFIFYIFKNSDDDFLTSLNKFFYTTPIIFLLLWSTKNYAETRLYLEKYAFKAILSVSITSYMELLESKFGRKKNNFEKFVFNSISKIFKEPYRDKEKKQIVNFLGGKVIYENSEKIIGESERENNIIETENSEENEE